MSNGQTARRREDVRFAVGAVLVIAALVWVAVTMQTLSHDLRDANEARDALARQVQQLGGTPIAGKPGSRSAVGPSDPSGPPGPPGPSGPQGREDEAGRPGARGKTGSSGAPGEAGQVGVAGALGPTGPAGPQGEPGPTGPPGDHVEQGPAGPPGPACPTATRRRGIRTRWCAGATGPRARGRPPRRKLPPRWRLTGAAPETPRPLAEPHHGPAEGRFVVPVVGSGRTGVPPAGGTGPGPVIDCRGAGRTAAGPPPHLTSRPRTALPGPGTEALGRMR
jgi:hypothetical protein